jgi:hypothetical protein
MHVHGPSTSFKLSTGQLLPTAANTLFPLSSVNINASDGELGHINHCSQATMLLWLQLRTTALYSVMKEVANENNES